MSKISPMASRLQRYRYKRRKSALYTAKGEVVMTTGLADIIAKYQGVAPHQIIAAMQKAAARTGADFVYLMEKASTESNFDPKAHSKGSSATGLFQFIDSTASTMSESPTPASVARAKRMSFRGAW